jgi:catechol 2,3-dioxygenase-like lactoylglutathione lyase family enzyme
MTFFIDSQAPRLMVSSLERAVAFYDRVLGFDPIDVGGSEAVVRRARVTLCLCQGQRDALSARDGHCPWDMLFWVGDCASLCREYTWRGAAPTLYDAFGPVAGGEEGLSRNVRTMQIEDLDHHVLRFVQADAQVGGE